MGVTCGIVHMVSKEQNISLIQKEKQDIGPVRVMRKVRGVLILKLHDLQKDAPEETATIWAV